jgi:hypothetical protein
LFCPAKGSDFSGIAGFLQAYCLFWLKIPGKIGYFLLFPLHSLEKGAQKGENRADI